ncbi:MAG: hypothetical protein Crog4KO_20880 [Crocinitomicaceae bacterium]
MKRYLIEIFAPANSNTKYKIWVAISLLIQVTAALIPVMLIHESTQLHQYFLISVSAIVLVSLLITKTYWQKWIAYGLAIFGLFLGFTLVVMDLTNTGMNIYLLAWSMSVSLGYGRELFNLKWFFAFMSFVLVLFGFVLYFTPHTEYTALERGISILSGAFVIAINIVLWSREAKMSSNHYSERRQKYEDVASLSEKMTAILASKQNAKEAFVEIAEAAVPSLHLDYCMIYLFENNALVSADGKEKIDFDAGTIVGGAFSGMETLININSSLSNYKRIEAFSTASSEIATPIYNNEKIQGVIYGASRAKEILRERHYQAFNVIASFCGLKLAQTDAEKSIRDAERTEAEVQKYKELDELKNRFITNISHDLKTPLSLIKAPAKQIQQTSKDAKVKGLAKYITNNADHLLSIVHQLLQLNRIEKGINELYIQRVNLKALCNKVNGQYEEQARSKFIDLSINAKDVTIVTDAFRLEQIIHNLLSNALRYTPEKGKISVTCIQEENTLKCIVSDTGTGIPKELQTKVFERFYKIDENNQEGTGIGLSLVKEYTEQLEGTISLKSEPSSGTTFTLTFPMAHSQGEQLEQEAKQESASDALAPEAEGKMQMLVVEDHADLNNFVSSFFENDFITYSAFDGDEALQKMHQNLPDIVITDLMMPKKDGKSLVEAIRANEEWSHIPIIVLSAKSKVENKIELYETGVDNFLAKPFEIEELQAVVQSTLKQRKALRDAFRQKFLLDPIGPTLATSENLTSTDESQESTLIEEVRNFVLEHLDNSELAISDLAKSLGYGRNRFQKEVKELSGLTPVEFVRSLRLYEANQMLRDPSKTISEVAYSVGFSNLSYFTRSFKQEFGVLPSELRQ